MPYCIECQMDAEVVARCAGNDCRASICPLCFTGDGLCSECRASEFSRHPVRCDDLTPELQAILWAGISRPTPRCPRTGDDVDGCECIDIDDGRTP